MPNITAVLTTAAAALAAALPSAAAQVTAKQTVLAETVTVDETGRRTITTAPAEAVTPGDRVAYVLSYENEGDAPAEGLVLVMPVPGNVAWLPDADAGTMPEPSVDGGASYGDLSGLRVTEDGEPRPATPADVTHLRWRLADSVAPGAGGEVRYRGVLR